ncbi:MAG: amino acid adenylation domain-containing protein [Acidobacteriota bacterium]
MIQLLPQLLERAAGRDPGRDAFRAPRSGLAYGELEARANRLARALRADGVRRGDRVGIFRPRDLDTAVAVYGILKAGAAFVPIDPHAPAGALRAVVDDCGLRHLVSHRQQLRTLRALRDAGPGTLQTVYGLAPTPDKAPDGLDGLACRADSDVQALGGGSAPDVFMMEDDLAYLMYSSGSTGRPKGIMHTHRSGLAYARLSAELYGVTAEDRVGNHSPLHFDMSTFGYFTAPYAGATTLLVPEAYTKMPASLSQLIEAERLTIWYSVPLALIQLLTRGVLERRDCTSLRWVLFGGEPFSRKHLHALMRRWPGARFSNVYGPAEVNQCTYFHVPPPAGDGESPESVEAPVPIGRTWDQTEGLVIDAEDRVLDGACEGQLVIRSTTRMAGYWARPDLDAGAFFRQNVGGGFERVFYRTGDLVSRDSGGELTFLGRVDRQVKVRGYRLELDEIERTVTAHPAVEEAGVVALRGADRADGGDADALYGAYSCKPDQAVEPADLRAFLAARVSPYAVPDTLQPVDVFPRTSSGKIDRRRLAERAQSQALPDGLAPANGVS